MQIRRTDETRFGHRMRHLDETPWMRRLGQPLGETGFAGWVVRALLGCALVMTGVFNLLGWGRTEQAFASLGLGDAVRIVVGLVEIGAGLLMFVPGMGLIAAGIVVALMGLGFLVRMWNAEAPMALISAAFVFCAGLVAMAAVRARQQIRVRR